MAFISGPRQVGKTTLSQIVSQSFDQSIYKNWDQTEFRRIWTKQPDHLTTEFNLARVNQSRLLILDEIHKAPLWKQKVKGLFDTRSEDISIMVTGSARLNVFKKGGDSLLGRYFHFRLHPLSLREALGLRPHSPDLVNQTLFSGKAPHLIKKSQDTLSQLLHFGGFPEPFLKKDESFSRLWRRGRTDKIIREDLRDLTRIQEISQVQALLSLLPEKIGQPLSIQSLREDLEVAHDTVSRWLRYLQELYLFFEIKPFSKRIPRSLKKEGKIYFYDWSDGLEKGARFENFVASHLLKACHYWEDTGAGSFDLHYLRNKEKNEIDFLVSKDKRPWFTVECKYADSNLDTTHQKFSEYLGCSHIQVVLDKDLFRKVNHNTFIMGADFFLSSLV